LPPDRLLVVSVMDDERGRECKEMNANPKNVLLSTRWSRERWERLTKWPTCWEPDSWRKSTERALLKELTLRGVRAASQVRLSVSYKGQHIGEYAADLVVEDRLLVEVKCVERFSNEHLAQCLNYLKASRLKIALLVNFQHPKVEWKRVVRDF
jgi:GxxExxY protein